MKIEILKVNGRWLINGKPYISACPEGRIKFDKFVNYMKNNYKP